MGCVYTQFKGHNLTEVGPSVTHELVEHEEIRCIKVEEKLLSFWGEATHRGTMSVFNLIEEPRIFNCSKIFTMKNAFLLRVLVSQCVCRYKFPQTWKNPSSLNHKAIWGGSRCRASQNKVTQLPVLTIKIKLHS